MLKQALNLIRSGGIFPWTVTLLFYGFVFAVIANAELPALPDQAFALRQRLWENNKQDFRDPNEAFSIFAPYAPPQGSVSFITDVPYNLYSMDIAKTFSAQSYFVPLILNPFPQENHAFVYCSSEAIATTRLRESGYQLRASLGAGKGLAEKTL